MRGGCRSILWLDFLSQPEYKYQSNGGAAAPPFFRVFHKTIAANVCPLPAKQVNHSLLDSIFVDVTKPQVFSATLCRT
jgi:hypothetical protein